MSDEDVARAWRQHADETPPAGVDAAVLAAAHRAVGSGPSTIRRAAWMRSVPRWWAPLAAAATIGAIAVGVLQLAPRDDDAFAPAPARNAEVNVRSQRAATMSSEPPPLAASEGAKPAPTERAPTAPTAPTDRAPTAPTERAPTAPTERAPTAPTERAIFAPSERAKFASSEPAPPMPSNQAPSAPPVTSAPRPAMATGKSNAAATTAPAQPTIAQPPPPPSGAGRQATPEPLAQGAVTKQENAATAAPAPATSGGFVPDAPATSADSSATMTQRMPEAPRADSSSKIQTPMEGPRETTAIGGAARQMAAEPSAAAAKSYASAPQRKTNLRSPESFTTRIALLRKEGNDVAATSELRAFRMAYSDADRRLPPELRDWAATIKP